MQICDNVKAILVFKNSFYLMITSDNKTFMHALEKILNSKVEKKINYIFISQMQHIHMTVYIRLHQKKKSKILLYYFNCQKCVKNFTLQKITDATKSYVTEKGVTE